MGPLLILWAKAPAAERKVNEILDLGGNINGGLGNEGLAQKAPKGPFRAGSLLPYGCKVWAPLVLISPEKAWMGLEGYNQADIPEKACFRRANFTPTFPDKKRVSDPICGVKISPSFCPSNFSFVCKAKLVRSWQRQRQAASQGAPNVSFPPFHSKMER